MQGREWDDFAVFREWAMAHGYTDDMTIDRLDGDGDYTPDNCRWISKSENCKYKRSTKLYTHEGVTLSHNDWARKIGISPSTLTKRIQAHGLEYALSAGKRISEYEESMGNSSIA